MIYQVLFSVNRGTNSLVLTVGTSQREPDPDVVRHAELVLVPEPEVGFFGVNLGMEGLRVVKDRQDVFRQREEVPEAKVLAWIRSGRGVLGPEYKALFQHS